MAGKLVALLMAVVLAAGCTTEDRPRKEKASPRRAAAEPKREDPVKALLAMDYTRMADVLQLCLPTMGDSVNQPSVGGTLFAIWAGRHMQLAHVKGEPETSFAAVKKDSAGERGKRFCFNGKIVEITKSDNGQGDTMYEGKMFDSHFNIATFYAARSTDGIFEGTKTRFCGVVSGRHSYSNAGGGTSHSVEMIGVFDIPANRVR